MTWLVVAWVLGAAALHAAWNGVVKGRSGDPLAASLGLCAVWVVVGLPLLFVVPPPSAESVPHLVASVLIHLVYLSLLIAAYRSGDLSLVYTIARGTPPVIVAVLSWIVARERVGALGAAGVGLIAAGVLALSPRAPEDPARKTRPRRAMLLAFATAACIASYTLVDGIGVRLSGSAGSYLAWLMTFQGLGFSLGAAAVGRRRVIDEALARWRTVVVAAVMSAGGYGIALWAMAQAPIALVAALRETSVLFAAVIGAVALREPFGRRRVVAAALVTAGAVCIRFAG